MFTKTFIPPINCISHTIRKHVSYVEGSFLEPTVLVADCMYCSLYSLSREQGTAYSFIQG